MQRILQGESFHTLGVVMVACMHAELALLLR